MNNEQIEYVRNEIASGVTSEKITNDLLAAGYTAEQITELLQFVQNNSINAPKPVLGPDTSTK